MRYQNQYNRRPGPKVEVRYVRPGTVDYAPDEGVAELCRRILGAEEVGR